MITSKTIANGILRAMAVALGVYILLLFLLKIQTVLLYIIISLIVTMIASPIITFFKRKLHFPHVAAVLTTLAFFILLMVGFIMMFVPLIVSQSENLSLLDTAQLEQDVLSVVDKINAFLADHDIDSKKMISQADITSKLDFNFIPEFINSLLGILSGFGMGFASVLFITFFLLKDYKQMDSGFRKLLPVEHADRILSSLRKIDHLLSRYFIGLIMQMSILFVMYLIVLLIFGVENALIIAFVTAFLNIIPYIGPLIATILVIVLTMLGMAGPETQADMLSTTLYVVIGYTLAQVIDNNVSTPLIFSNSVNSHPLEIFLVILISGFVFGILGMIIAVPLYTVIKVAAKEFYPKSRVVRMLTKDL